MDNVTTFLDGYAAAEYLSKSGLDMEYIFTNGDDVVTGVRQYYLDHKLSAPD
ncbi:hypothetical protein ACFQ5M_02245 [Agrilactobacillus yilanensis]|uniref:Uncharacterized protein n=1 Tax=Agrilactobacillus yilanensis TaxID=2485997 RepID=A0ABW4J5P8_9LACO|nr:hypothetical protein [Agrilactobacillus yilanensis]